MTQIWILIAVGLSLAWFHEHARVSTYGSKLSDKKISSVFIIMTVILGGFLGLRTSYNDTFSYTHAYGLMKKFPDYWRTFSLSLSTDPGFNLCNAILKTCNISEQNFLMIYALITIGLYLHFIRVNRNDLLLNVFLFFCTGSYIFAGAAIKQSFATAICLCALPYAVEKRWDKFILLVMLASTFHVYAAIYFLTPVLMFQPWTKRTFILVMGTVVTAVSLPMLMKIIIGITSGIGEAYTVDEFSGAGVNIFRVLVCNVPFLLALVFHREIFKDSTKKENLMFNLAMVNGGIMFIGLFGTANYFARLANYFLAPQVIVLPWMIDRIPFKYRKIIKPCMIAGYLGYFYYSCNVVYGTFNSYYKRISVIEYFQGLL